MPRETLNEGIVDMFDNPEYYKAAFEQEQIKCISLELLIHDLRSQLDAKDLAYTKLQETCCNHANQIIILEENNAILIAENKELVISNEQHKIELAAFKKDGVIIKKHMSTFFSKPISIKDIDLSRVIDMYIGDKHPFNNYVFSCLNDIIHRLTLLESAILQNRPTTMNFAGDYVVSKHNILENK